MDLLHLVFGTDDDLACFGISEEEHFLGSKGDDKHGDVVFQDFAIRDLLG